MSLSHINYKINPLQAVEIIFFNIFTRSDEVLQTTVPLQRFTHNALPDLNGQLLVISIECYFLCTGPRSCTTLTTCVVASTASIKTYPLH